MPIKQHKPTSPGRRFQTTLRDDEVDAKKKPERKLTHGLRKKGGRNVRGVITVRFRGGGSKRRLRDIDFKRNKNGVPARVAAIERDPGRSAHIALLHYRDGEKRYILAPQGVKVGDILVSGERVPVRPGNCMLLANIPLGTVVHCVELSPGRGGQLVRSAGAGAQLVAREGQFAQLRLPSGETRLVFVGCRATIGVVGNEDHGNISMGKAGRRRWLGRRPHVRGSAMNPKDHPHGGGEGKAPIGRPGPVSPWGQPTLGKKTRRKKQSDKMIVRRRRT